MRYNVNDTVIYKTNGICKITEIAEQDFTGKNIEYFVLKPVYDNKRTIYISVQNEKLIAEMRRILSADEICDLIKTIPIENTIWIVNDSERSQRYKEILTRGDRTDLFRLIKTLYQRQRLQNEKGKKLHIADERFLKEAEKMLHEEFAYVLNIKREQVLPFILDQMEAADKSYR